MTLASPIGAKGRLWLILPAIFLSACSLAPDRIVPERIEGAPDSFSHSEISGEYRPTSWWHAFEDPALNTLISNAVDENFSLREAIARVERARAAVDEADADRVPEVDIAADAQYQNQPAGQFGAGFAGDQSGSRGGSQSGPAMESGRIETTRQSLALNASYELDFWQRVANESDAAAADFEAARADLQTALLTVIAETIRAYFDVVAVDQRLDLAKRLSDLLNERYDLSEQRYLRGLIDSFELYAIVGQLRQAEASIPQLEQQLYAATARLAVLTGAYPSELEDMLRTAAPLTPELPLEPIAPGSPAAMLMQRPDLRAAWQQLEAQRFRVGVRRAALFPSVSLSAAIGLQNGTGVPGGLESWFANLAASILQPVFRGGEIRSRIDAAEAGLARQAAAFSQTALEAFEDVETALQNHGSALSRYRLLRDDLEAAQASADVQLRRYLRGVGDYLAWLDARRNFLEAKSELVVAERGVAEARIAVHRALGGTWVEADLTQRGQALIAASLGEPVMAGKPDG